MLTRRRLFSCGPLSIVDVACRSGRSSWSSAESTEGYGVVFVRSGCFRRRVSGIDAFLDAAVAYFERPGDEQQVEHPSDGGDTCTGIELAPELLASIAGGDLGLPTRLVFTAPALDLTHRMLLAHVRRGGDAFEASERALELVAATVEAVDAERVAAGRPATVRSRRQIVDAARERLALEPATDLFELAAAVATSPHHLSRIFRALTGETVSGYRNRLRVRIALERLSEGEPNLARLAAELGFADHAHLTRTMRRVLGATPSALRAQLV
jgi:AraC-like DNA-binding protein